MHAPPPKGEFFVFRVHSLLGERAEKSFRTYHGRCLLIERYSSFRAISFERVPEQGGETTDDSFVQARDLSANRQPAAIKVVVHFVRTHAFLARDPDERVDGVAVILVVALWGKRRSWLSPSLFRCCCILLIGEWLKAGSSLGLESDLDCRSVGRCRSSLRFRGGESSSKGSVSLCH